MAPPKFDDIPKAAKDVLDDDLEVDGYSMKTKMKTNFEGLNDIFPFKGDDNKQGAVVSQQINLNFGEDLKIGAPAKVSLKFGNPLGCPGISFKKIELDKKHDGNLKFESEIDAGKIGGPKGLMGECIYSGGVTLSNNAGLNGLGLGLQYTGINNTLFKAFYNFAKPKKGPQYSVDATVAEVAGCTLGCQHTPESPLDLAVSYSQGSAFGAVRVTESFTTFTLHGKYAAFDNIDVAAHYALGGSKNGHFSAVLAHAGLKPGMTLKAKLGGKDLTGDTLVGAVGVKYDLAKGCTMIAGTKFPLGGCTEKQTFGAQFSIE